MQRGFVRSVLATAAAGLAALAIAACGSSGASGSSPANRALSYFPASSPLVMTVATDPHARTSKQARALEHRFPGYAVAATALFAQMSKLGIDFNQDVRPLFGNPIAIGAAGSSGLAGSGAKHFLVAWVTRSADGLARLVGKLHGIHAAGSHDGAKLYSKGGSYAAVDGATVLIGPSVADIDAALDRHANDSGLTAADYARETAGIPSGGLITIFGDLTGALSSSRAATARKVPWLAAIRGYWVSIAGTQTAAHVTYHIDTGGRSLSVSQLPIASGTTSPGLAGSMPIQASLRDPAQTINFILSAIRATDPSEYAKLISEEGLLKVATGIDVNSQIAALSGNLNLESDGHTTLVRVQLTNPSSFSTMLSKIAGASALTGGGLRSLGGGFYAIQAGKRVTVGVVGNQLVAGNATPAQLTAFAGAPTASAPGGAGAVAFRIALPQLVALALHGAPSGPGQQVLRLLGDVTGSLRSSTSGLTGTASLALR